MATDPEIGIDTAPLFPQTRDGEEDPMSGLGVVAVVIGGVAVAGAVCWVVIGAALRRTRDAGRGRRD